MDRVIEKVNVYPVERASACNAGFSKPARSRACPNKFGHGRLDSSSFPREYVFGAGAETVDIRAVAPDDKDAGD